MRLEGRDAIEYAQAHGLRLNKYADPTEEAREGLTADEADRIAREDPNLIYLDVPAKVASKSRYAEICEELGICPGINFLTIEKGKIGYSCGKPEEIRLLASRATAAGYNITKSLRISADR